MNFTTIQEAVRVAIASATGLSDVQWQNSFEAGGWRGADHQAHVDLVLRSPVGVGVDETVHEYNAVDDVIEVYQAGPRQFGVSVRIESESQLPGEGSVGSLAGLLRTRLRRASILAGLRTAGVGLATIGNTIDADYPADGRMVSLSITEIVFLTSDVDQDTTDTGDYIAAIAVTATDLNIPETIIGTPVAP